MRISVVVGMILHLITRRHVTNAAFSWGSVRRAGAAGGSMATFTASSRAPQPFRSSCLLKGSAANKQISTHADTFPGYRQPPDSDDVDVDDDSFLTDISPTQYSGPLPPKFAYPFWYEPHPVSIWASDQLRAQLRNCSRWTDHFGDSIDSSTTATDEESSDASAAPVGKMFGVLVVRTPLGTLGYLKGYSGTVPEGVGTKRDGFVPVLYDRFAVEGFYKRGEAQLNETNREVEELANSPDRAERKARLAVVEAASRETLAETRGKQKARKKERRQKRSDMRSVLLNDEDYEAFDAQMVQESNADQRLLKALRVQLKHDVARAQESVDEIDGRLGHLKRLRKEKSADLQNQLFDQYQFLNMRGETQSLRPIFAETPLQRPPAGAGDCAAPKLLQYAFSKGYTPISMAEFWWGKSPALEVRKHGFYYPACRGKCEPILGHMLQGLEVEDNPLEQAPDEHERLDVEIIFDDEYMAVVNKPGDMLSVPGRKLEHSVYTEMKKRYPESTGPLLVHRLDMSTSGLLIVAKDKETHAKIQAQFIDRSIKKRYTSVLEGVLRNKSPKGKIDLPLTGDYLNRPMQKVDFEEGKPAETFYEVVQVSEGRTRAYFYPVTGRTHQLRVHAAHTMGLNTPIVGDDIYGQRDERLHLHAGRIEMTHPVTQKRLTFTVDAPF